MSGARSDLPGDPGLVPTKLRSERGPFVGTAPRPNPLRRMAREARLDRLLLELHRGFGWQRWWPARTPFEVVVGAVLTQNTAWTNVERALASLGRRVAITPARLLALEEDELALAIRSSGYYRAKAKKLRAVSDWYLDCGGLRALRKRRLEDVRAELLGIWGVGPETADSILCYAAGRRTAVVDTYTRRMLSRHGFVDVEMPYEELRDWLRERLVGSQLVYEEFHALCVRTGHGNCRPVAVCGSCPATAPPGFLVSGRGTGTG